jgi:hypothetical protein
MYSYSTVIFFLIIHAFGNAQHSTIPQASADILNLHQTKFRWFQEKKLDSIAYLLHPDVNYIHSNGWVEHKSEVIENIQSGKLTYTKVEVLNADVTISENTAIVLGTGMFSVSLNDKPIVIKLLYTEVYTTIDKIPRLIHRHACRLD